MMESDFFANLVGKASELAAKAHADQKYGGLSYFVGHLCNVAALAVQYEHCVHPADYHDHWPVREKRMLLLIVAYLHDILEDTSVGRDRIDAVFGTYIGDLVDNLTDHKVGNRATRKLNTWHKIRKSPISVYIKLCDRLANTRSGGKLEMYRKEFPLFQAALYTPGQFESLWDELELATFPEKRDDDDC